MRLGVPGDDPIADEALAAVTRWLATAPDEPHERARVRALLADTDGSRFVSDIVDSVMRPESDRVVVRSLARLAGQAPDSIPARDRLALDVIGGFGTLFPGAFAPLGRRLAWRRLGSHVLTADPATLDRHLDEIEADGGIRPVLALLAPHALGDRRADRNLADARSILAHERVEALAVSLPSVARLGTGWDLLAEADRVADRLVTLGVEAAVWRAELSLDVDRYRELELSIAVARRLREHPELEDLEVGVTLPAAFPDSFASLQRLVSWASTRGERGGRGVTLRITDDVALAAEHEEAVVREWPLATFADARDADAQFVRMLDWVLTPERTSATRVVVSAGLAATAYAWRLALARRVLGQVEFEWPWQVASHVARAVKRDVGGLRVRVPAMMPGVQVAATDIDRIERAIRLRLDGALPHEPHDAEGREPPETNRSQPKPWRSDTDPSIPESRDWAMSVVRDAMGIEPRAIAPADDLDRMVTGAADAGREWAERRGSTRAAVLRSVADSLPDFRSLLVATAVGESGLTFADADHEVTEAIDIAGHLAGLAAALSGIDRAVLTPSEAVVAVTGRQSPIADPLALILAPLAAGSAVIVKPAPENQRSIETLVEIIIDGGVPAELLRLMHPDEGDDAKALMTHPRVGRILHSGSRHVAKLLKSWRPELPLLSSTGGRNAIVVTESADVDSAVADVVESAFHHAGQHPASVGQVVLVGDDHDRFVGLLTDAVASLRIGPATDPETEVGPLVRPARDGVLESLTELAAGERWLVRPTQKDEEGRLWSAGLVDGVEAGSRRHVTERRAPVLALLHADTLDDALALQTASGFGLVAGLQSLDRDEVAFWLERVEAGRLAVNAPTRRVLPTRQPSVGWHRSRVGHAAAVGGPSQLLPLVDAAPVEIAADESVSLGGVSAPVAELIVAAQPAMSFAQFDWVRHGARDDERVWRGLWSGERERAELGVERNLLRHVAVPVTVRLAEGGSMSELVRVLAAATLVRAPVAVSSAVPLPSGLIEFFATTASPVAEVLVETDARWHARVHGGQLATDRIRLVGGDPVVLDRVRAGNERLNAWGGPVTLSGFVELRPFLAEQSIRMRGATLITN